MAEAPFAPQLERLQQLVDQSNRIVFFGGAGVSTESGIPDFRSQDGLYRQQWQYPPEEIVSHSFFTQKTQEFYRFYRQKMLWLEAEPNAAHRGLARLEREGKVFVFAPDSTLGVSRTERDVEKLRLLWGTGYQMAADRMEELRDYLSR